MAISDLRNKLKPTPAAAMAEADAQLDATMGRKGSNYNNEKHSIDVGTNLFKFYPPHEQYDERGKPNPFAEPVVTTYVPGMILDRDKDGKEQKDEKGNIKLKLGMRPVFNSKVHGKRDANGLPVTKDLIEEFIRLMQEKAKTIDLEEERKEFMVPVYGRFINKGNAKNVNGINYAQKWSIYADKIDSQGAAKIAELEVGKAVKNSLNKIAAIESANEPLGTDPFTDLDEGRGVKIVYNNSADKPEDYYTVMLDNSTVSVVLEGGKKANVVKTYPISDENLEKFSKMKPLAELYRNVFKSSDFQIQLKGLREVDVKYKIGIFDTEEFQAIAEEIATHYPPEEDKKAEPTTATTTEKTTVEEKTETQDEEMTAGTPEVVTETQTGDDFDVMTREELKEFCKDNSTGIIVKPVSLMSDNQLRDAIRGWMNAKDIKVEEPIPDELSKHIGTEKHTLPESEVKISAKDRLEALKAKAGEVK